MKQTVTSRAFLLVLILGMLVIGVGIYFKKIRPGGNLYYPAWQMTIKGEERKSVGKLDNYGCFSRFMVPRDKTLDSSKPVMTELKLDLFESFYLGTFFGKIKNYEPSMRKDFSGLIDELMQEEKIKTYTHLNAIICLNQIDLLNPPNGASLTYYVSHSYCTSECQSESYFIDVNLKSDGNFIGYKR